MVFIKNIELSNKLQNRVPYLKYIGFEVGYEKQQSNLIEDLIFHLPFSEKLIGNTTVPAIHGGVICGFAENSALIHLLQKCNLTQLPITIDFSLEYLHMGLAESMFAKAFILRKGSRISQVRVSVWQKDFTKPIVTARANILVTN